MLNHAINILQNQIRLQDSPSIMIGIAIWIATGAMTIALIRMNLVKIYTGQMETLGMEDLVMVTAAGDASNLLSMATNIKGI